MLPAGSPYAQNCDFLTVSPSPYVQLGQLAIPNPYTGTMDSVGKYQNPWQFNLGALIRYEISPKVTANLTLTNLVNTCFGGTSTPWTKAFKPSKLHVRLRSQTGSFLGTQPGAGFFYEPRYGSGQRRPAVCHEVQLSLRIGIRCGTVPGVPGVADQALTSARSSG